MTRKFSALFAAGFGALALATAVASHAHDRPSSVNESGAVPPTHHQVAPSNSAPATGRSAQAAAQRDVRGYGSAAGTYEVQTPSSVNESAPWLANERTRR